MPTPKKGPRLGGSPSHQKAILANLATSLFEHGAITTTEVKARVLRPYAEKLITKAKRGDLHNRRQVMSVIRDKSVVHTLFTEIAHGRNQRKGIEWFANERLCAGCDGPVLLVERRHREHGDGAAEPLAEL